MHCTCMPSYTFIFPLAILHAALTNYASLAKWFAFLHRNRTTCCPRSIDTTHNKRTNSKLTFTVNAPVDRPLVVSVLQTTWIPYELPCVIRISLVNYFTILKSLSVYVILYLPLHKKVKFCCCCC